MHMDSVPGEDSQARGFISETCEDIVVVAVDILRYGEYSIFQLEDIRQDLEAVRDEEQHLRHEAAERQSQEEVPHGG